MSDLGRVAFYAPLKSPEHPTPSGDRAMARLFMAALERAGATPMLASELRTLDLAGNPEAQQALLRRAKAEAARLVALWRPLAASERPRLWFTYHSYYKAPDWIGPQVADALAIPYVIAEASRAGKRAHGPWTLSHAGAEAAADRADVILVMTTADREALERLKPLRQALIDCPPFLDVAAWPVSSKQPRAEGPPRLLTVAMMREGAKRASYAILADALERLRAQPWTLDIVGDGDARGPVEALFGGLQDRVVFRGQIDDRKTLGDFYAAADLFLWPAVDEAYGMALLEAQAHRCPVVAGRCGGVASVVRHGETGFLTEPGDAVSFADAVAALLGDEQCRRRLAVAAFRFVRDTRDLASAAASIRAGLDVAMAR